MRIDREIDDAKALSHDPDVVRALTDRLMFDLTRTLERESARDGEIMPPSRSEAAPGPIPTRRPPEYRRPSMVPRDVAQSFDERRTPALSPHAELDAAIRRLRGTGLDPSNAHGHDADADGEDDGFTHADLRDGEEHLTSMGGDQADDATARGAGADSSATGATPVPAAHRIDGDGDADGDGPGEARPARAAMPEVQQQRASTMARARQPSPVRDHASHAHDAGAEPATGTRNAAAHSSILSPQPLADRRSSVIAMIVERSGPRTQVPDGAPAPGLRLAPDRSDAVDHGQPPNGRSAQRFRPHARWASNDRGAADDADLAAAESEAAAPARLGVVSLADRVGDQPAWVSTSLEFSHEDDDPDFAVPRILRRPTSADADERPEDRTTQPPPAVAPPTLTRRPGVPVRVPAVHEPARGTRIAWLWHMIGQRPTAPVSAGVSAGAVVVALAVMLPGVFAGSQHVARHDDPGTRNQTAAATADAVPVRLAGTGTTSAIQPTASASDTASPPVQLVRTSPTPLLPGTVLVGPGSPARRSAEIIEEAERMIGRGDLPSARAMLDRAVGQGDARATLALAETYDPNMLAAWGARGHADVSTARALYGRALAAGMERARVRLEALN